MVRLAKFSFRLFEAGGVAQVVESLPRLFEPTSGTSIPSLINSTHHKNDFFLTTVKSSINLVFRFFLFSLAIPFMYTKNIKLQTITK
jgi:hypothetical protein